MKSNLDKAYKTVSSLETEGIWFNVSNETAFRLRRFGGSNSKNIDKARMKYFKPFAAMIDKGLLSVEKDLELTAQFFVDSCLVDWRGVVIEEKDTPFSKEVAIEFFTGLPDLLQELMKESTNMTYFKEDYKESLGNS